VQRSFAGRARERVSQQLGTDSRSRKGRKEQGEGTIVREKAEGRNIKIKIKNKK
jgi:hypothetical protein